MFNDINKFHRRSIRLKEYDYSQPGWYFITIVGQDREFLFSKIINGKIELEPAGKIIEKDWLKIPELRYNIILDQFVIMPNHFHGVIIINEKPDTGRATESVAPTLKSNTLGAILGKFKSVTTKEIRKSGILHFKWQRNYWERIIRNESELNRIQQYIINNPVQWEDDKYHG